MSKTIDEKIDDLAVTMAAGFEAVDKNFEAVNKKFAALQEYVDKKFDGLEKKVDGIDKTVCNLPDKAFVTDKLADVKGEIVLVVRREDKKVDFAFDRLQQRGAWTKADVEEAHEKFQVFPTLG